MKLKDLYIMHEARRYSGITKIKKENVSLEMKPLNKIKENIVVLIILLTLVIGLLIIGFNAKYFIVSVLLIIGFFFLFIFGNKAKLTCDKKFLNVKQGLQNVNIPYSSLRNVYIGKVSGFLFFLPAFNYNIVIRYEDNFSFLRELEFSLLCANDKEVEEFINNFEIEQVFEERYIVYEKKKSWKKLIGFIGSLILLAVLILYIFPACGIKLF